MEIEDRMRKLLGEQEEESVAVDTEKPDLGALAQTLVLALLPTAPDDPQDAAEFTVDLMKQLIRNKAKLVRAYQLLKPGKARRMARQLSKDI